MSKVVIGGTSANPTVTRTETTIADRLTKAVTAPLGILSDDETTFYGEVDMAYASLTAVAAGVFIGDRWGDKIPVLGQRRAA